jgi:hypothetical protein
VELKCNRVKETGHDIKKQNIFYHLHDLKVYRLLFFFGFIATRSLEAADNAAGPEVLLSATGLEQRSLTLVSSSPLVVEGQTLGEVLVYDDPTTKRPADYFELHDNPGDLIAVGWFDRFGIERTAVDRGILDGEGELEGVFVSLLEGDSI